MAGGLGGFLGIGNFLGKALGRSNIQSAQHRYGKHDFHCRDRDWGAVG